MLDLTVADLLKPAFRLAGVTDRPGREPSPEQYAEGIGILRRMIGSWNCNPLDTFGTSIDVYPLVANKKIYTIGGPGLGADFDAAVPQRITDANILLTGTPTVRKGVKILNRDQWAAISLQDIGGAIPYALYPDYNFPLCNIYVRYQAPAGYQLELYTWQRIPVFAQSTDIVTLPDGYEQAIVTNGALLIAQQFPSQAHLDPRTEKTANYSLAAVESRNAPVPYMRNDYAGMGSGRGSDANWWRAGG
jgi:hypothetical protein